MAEYVVGTPRFRNCAEYGDVGDLRDLCGPLGMDQARFDEFVRAVRIHVFQYVMVDVQRAVELCSELNGVMKVAFSRGEDHHPFDCPSWTARVILGAQHLYCAQEIALRGEGRENTIAHVPTPPQTHRAHLSASARSRRMAHQAVALRVLSCAVDEFCRQPSANPQNSSGAGWCIRRRSGGRSWPSQIDVSGLAKSSALATAQCLRAVSGESRTHDRV